MIGYIVYIYKWIRVSVLCLTIFNIGHHDCLEIINGTSGDQICSDTDDCKINCFGNYSCEFDQLYCPLDGYDCTIVCIGSGACYYTIINYGTGNNTLLCDGDYACHGVLWPIPDPNTPLIVTCDDRYECQWGVIICPTNSDCTVQCIADYACFYTRIVWPTSSAVNNTMTCNGTNACYLTTPIPTFIDAPNTKDYALNCNSPSQCVSYIINCPADYGCFISCNKEYACRDIRIHWIETQSYNLVCNGSYHFACWGVNSIKSSNQSTPLTLHCNEGYACAYSTVYCPINVDCIIQCRGDDSCFRMIVYGPTDHQLTINCTSDASCWSITVHAQNASLFYMDCNSPNEGYNSCWRMTIYFPPNDDGSKRALINDMDEAHYGTGSDIRFYAINGWLDVNISGVSGPIVDGIMYCGIGYNLSCIIASDGDSCDSSNTVCDIPPTISPTYSPSQPPSHTPSLEPSFTPSPEPSFPTKMPTSNESIIPSTFNPTTYTPNPILSVTKTTILQDDSLSELSPILLFIIIIIISVALLVCVFIIIYFVLKRKNSNIVVGLEQINNSKRDKTTIPTHDNNEDISLKRFKRDNDHNDVNDYIDDKNQFNNIDIENKIDIDNKFKNDVDLNDNIVGKDLIDTIKGDNNDKRKSIDITKYEQWDYDNVLIWIFSIKNGLFKQVYGDVLAKEVKNAELTGIDLIDLNTNDMKGFGINVFKHRKLLEKHIQKLKQNKNNYNNEGQ